MQKSGWSSTSLVIVVEHIGIFSIYSFLLHVAHYNHIIGTTKSAEFVYLYFLYFNYIYILCVKGRMHICHSVFGGQRTTCVYQFSLLHWGSIG